MRETPLAREIRKNTRVFAALGDATRVSILAVLSRGEPVSVSRLTRGRRITRQAVSKHLRVLESAGLVRSVRHGREVRFELQRARIDSAARALDTIAQQWDAALRRLKATLESPGQNAVTHSSGA